MYKRSAAVGENKQVVFQRSTIRHQKIPKYEILERSSNETDLALSISKLMEDHPDLFMKEKRNPEKAHIKEKPKDEEEPEWGTFSAQEIDDEAFKIFNCSK